MKILQTNGNKFKLFCKNNVYCQEIESGIYWHLEHAKRGKSDVTDLYLSWLPDDVIVNDELTLFHFDRSRVIRKTVTIINITED